MDALTRSSKPLPSGAARASVAFGLAALAVAPVAFALSRSLSEVTVLRAAFAVPVAGVFGVVAIVLARHARRQVQRTLGRIGGAGVARFGHALGVVGLCIGITGALALGFFGLLSLFS